MDYTREAYAARQRQANAASHAQRPGLALLAFTAREQMHNAIVAAIDACKGQNPPYTIVSIQPELTMGRDSDGRMRYNGRVC